MCTFCHAYQQYHKEMVDIIAFPTSVVVDFNESRSLPKEMKQILKQMHINFRRVDVILIAGEIN